MIAAHLNEHCVLAFRNALQSLYGSLDWLPVADATLHRFHVPGDRTGSRNGWYVLFADGLAAGAFGSWRTGETHYWSGGEAVTAAEAEQVRQRIEQARRQREAERHQRQQSAAKLANRWWHDAGRADTAHPYLVAKQVRRHALRQRGDELLVPLYHAGQLVNLQRITPDGGKRFLSGGQVKGSYSPLGCITAGQPLYACEGWATGATLHETTEAAVACAMNAGNLLSVGLELRRRYPEAMLIFAGDDDRQTAAAGKGNPGRAAANAAAVAVGGRVVFPDWPASAPPSLTDFNDLAVWRATREPA
ncbi:toprim domain-containing protein [Stutzerimonas frequens]|uniref:toprim domain-containing protein n=1 Tax=Stutzerimonas frequens TaxID=2968969 RepID=UPI0012E1F754|nr:toprim domain-containing protein [Stutzerimonas frequens]MUT71510.1 topoisomerase [Stutzerimonas frequens]